MPVEIKATITNEYGAHNITLPLTQNQLDEKLTAMRLYPRSADGYEITLASSSIKEMNPALAYAKDIMELNYLAQLLARFDNGELETFGAIVRGNGDILSMQQIVNLAHNFRELSIEQTIYDIEDLGLLYVYNNDPNTDEMIRRNKDEYGAIDYEGIGMELHISQGGEFSSAGYTSNFRAKVHGPYDGSYFPPYFYPGEQSVLGVSISPRGKGKSCDIFLPARIGAVNRALSRIKTSNLDTCDIKPCWGFPAPLCKKTLPGSDFKNLNAAANRLSVLTADQLKAVFNEMEQVGVGAAAEFSNLCLEKMQNIQMPEATNSVTYYFPLDIRLRDNGNEDYDENYWNDEVSSYDAIGYTEEILEQIETENYRFDTARMLAEYINENSPFNQKVYSMIPAVEEHEGALWGTMVMKIDGELTSDEVRELKEYITGQNSDGYGEGLEQREIQVSNGELYVSFWNSGSDYKVYTPEEFEAMIQTRQSAVSSAHAADRKPNCPLIGADSNVFNLIGIVSRTLKEHGMADAAAEMRNRVTSSGCFDEALGIMIEYVNPVSAEGTQHCSGFGMSMQ